MIYINLEYDYFQSIQINENWIKKICKMIMIENGHIDASITIIFSDDEKLRKLKKKYFKLDLLTDTITFNLEDKNDPIEGEIYISIDRVLENSKIYKQNFNQEYKRVIIHSCLHLLGYKDKNYKEKLIMTNLEDKYLAKIVNNKK